MKKNFHLFKTVILVLLASVCGNYNFAQISDVISSIKTGQAKEGQPINIIAELRSTANIAGILFAYKPFGESEFIKQEMLITANSASVLIPAENVKPPFIEYYFQIDMEDGASQTYPLGINEGTAPFQINVTTISGKDKEIIVLSPNSGEFLTPDDFLISISFIKAPDNVDIKATKVFLDGSDISSQALFAGDLIIFSGENFPGSISLGSKLIKIEVYDKNGNLYNTITRNFEVISKEIAQQIAARFAYSGDLRIEGRNEVYNNTSTGYGNFTANFNSTYSNWKANGYMYVTSEEKSYLQPVNRFSASFQSGDWLNIQVGDVYPRFPNLILDGKRVRGFSGGINLGFFNIQTGFGEVTRKVEGSIIQKYSADSAPLESNVIAIDRNKYGAPFASVNLATYTRNIFAIRPSFGTGENFQWGFSYLHGKDDPKSVEFGARPKENAVFGTDMKLALDDQNFLITGQAALSIVNNDISTGTLSDAQIDSVFGSGSFFDADPDIIKRIKNILGRFITVNQYIGPLNPGELSSLGAEGTVRLNYFNNTLKVTYIYRGNDYISFGQNFLRTDVQGINLFDRIRMFDNQVFLALGYEDLHDNLQKTKVATTKYKTYSASLSYFPRTDFPDLTFGYYRYDRNNGLNISDTVNGLYTVNDLTNRFSLSAGYRFNWRVRQSVSLSLSTSARDDNSLANADVTYSSAGLTVNSFWLSDFNSTFNVFYYASKIAGDEFDYVTFSLGGEYRLLQNKLKLAFSLSPSFGDFKRQALEFTASYNIIQNLDLMFQLRIYRIPGQSTNSIVGLVSSMAI